MKHRREQRAPELHCPVCGRLWRLTAPLGQAVVAIGEMLCPYCREPGQISKFTMTIGGEEVRLGDGDAV